MIHRRFVIPRAPLLALLFALSAPTTAPAADREGAEAAWIDVVADASLSAWRPQHNGWTAAADAQLDGADGRRLRTTAGAGVLVSADAEDAVDLRTSEEFQDVELRLEFLIPRGSNSGVKLNGLYEIQIRDSHGVATPTADDCGGVYPRADLGPPYRYLDKGVPPRVNAARPAGEWQTLELAFRSPRFDAAGEKTENARFLRVVLNGRTIHENVDLRWPTGAAWNMAPETPRGPLLLQGDHGPVAFRHIAIRPLSP